VYSVHYMFQLILIGGVVGITNFQSDFTHRYLEIMQVFTTAMSTGYCL
jgi:hypothetical protein